ncbi:MAG TPA: phospholipid carrier-dependent glycosyltransferase [Stellaceae bacterium]|nr:phospholipid carrier-dependent glycosyltransferase [Stellaceae bacterium]
MRRSGARLSAAWLYPALVGLCLLLYLPGQATIPVLDRDEARFAQATRQMLETGDFLHIRFQDEARNNKPAGIYWLQAAAVSAFSTPLSDAIWPYRLPSLIGATLAVLLLFAFGRALCADAAEPTTVAFLAAVLLATALGVVAEAHIAKTDAMLLAAATAGQGALGLAYLRARQGRRVALWIAAAFWAAEIAAMMIKGPIGPGLAVLTAATLALADRDVRWLAGLRPALGLAALIAAVAPWLFAVEHATHGRFLAASLGHDFLGKVTGAEDAHGAPPLFYLLLAFVTFWPGSLLLVPAVLRGWRRRAAATERFLLAWLLPGWIVLELVPTKLPHYVLPLYPALALLAAAALAEGTRHVAGGWPRRAELAATGLWAAVGLALAAALIAAPLRFGSGPAIVDMAGAVVVIGISAVLLRGRFAAIATTGSLAALSLAFVVPAATGVLPGLDRLWLSRAAATLARQHPPAAGAPLVAIGYSEPSLVFLLGGEPRLLPPQAAAAALRQGGEALVSNRDEAMFRDRLAAAGCAIRRLGSVSGLDYSNGRRLVLTLYAVSPGPPR